MSRRRATGVKLWRADPTANYGPLNAAARGRIDLAHFGRIFKTRHVLVFVDDEAYRRGIKAMRNLNEGRHDLGPARVPRHTSELHHGYRDGMEDQLGALGLVLNCITLRNTVYLDHAVARASHR